MREVRVLDGPNRHFTQPSIQVTLDADAGLSPDEVRQLAARIADAAGWPNLAIRVVAEPPRLLIAFPFRTEGTGVALGHEIAELLGQPSGPDRFARIRAAGDRVRAAEPGPRPAVPEPTVPTVVVTGTNGKTTVTRMIAHLGITAVARGWGSPQRFGTHSGRAVAWSSTDGVVVDGRVVDPGDWSGFGGAGRVLSEPDLALAVLEVARGGLIRRGIGTAHADAAVVTNIGSDHLGLDGIDTIEQLAEVKSAVTRIVRPTGWCVLNAEDERVIRMRGGTPGGVWAFALEPDAPGLAAVLAEGGRGATVVDATLVTIVDEVREPLVAVNDLPSSLAGVARFNVANALAAAAAGLAVGLPREVVAAGLASFRPDDAGNPGRMNLYALDGAVVIVDLAHNLESLAALLDVADALRPQGGRLLLALGLAGDRTDDLLTAMGRLAGERADLVAVVHKPHYLRGRDPDEMAVLLSGGVIAGGAPPPAVYPDERSGFDALLDAARPGDVVALMCHEDVAAMPARLAARGATPI